MRGFLIASCVLASLVVVSHAATLKLSKLVPYAACKGAGQPFPNPEDCGSFLQCEASGVAVVKKCPADLYFNPELKVCDWHDNVDCSASSESDSSSDSSSSEEGDGDGDGDDSSSEEDESADKATAGVDGKVQPASLSKKPNFMAIRA